MEADVPSPPTSPAADAKANPVPKSVSKRGKPGGSGAGGKNRAGKRTAPAGHKPADPITSKADLIRKVAGIIRAKGVKPRPSEIVKILAEEGVTVVPAQVSMTLKAAGYRPLRKRRPGQKPAAKAGPKTAPNAGRSGQITVDDLLAAKSVAGAFGGADKAIAALKVLRRLEK